MRTTSGDIIHSIRAGCRHPMPLLSHPKPHPTHHPMICPCSHPKPHPTHHPIICPCSHPKPRPVPSRLSSPHTASHRLTPPHTTTHCSAFDTSPTPHYPHTNRTPYQAHTTPTPLQAYLMEDNSTCVHPPKPGEPLGPPGWGGAYKGSKPRCYASHDLGPKAQPQVTASSAVASVYRK